MTITEPLELAASWLQVQLEVANHTAALDLEGLDATGKALVLQGWSLLTSAAKPGSQDSHGFQLPIWACILGLILILAMMFYLVNFMLWARREKAQRVHDLEDAKMHSEHGNLLGGLIEAAIERFDESLFGVNVDFGAMKVTVSYWSTHFLHIGELLIDLDLQSFITSMGKEVVIQRLELRDVEVIWEGGLVSSNMRDILKCMSGPKDDSNQSDKNRQKEGGERRTSVQEVLAQDISLKLASYWFCGSGPRIMVEDFYSQNLDEHQMGELEIPQCLLTMLLSSILANVLGQSIARFIMDGTSFGFAAVAHGIWHLVVLMRSACCCPPSPTKRDRPSRPKRPRAETERGSSTGTCGSCGSCLPCETLLQKKPAAKPSGNT